MNILIRALAACLVVVCSGCVSATNHRERLTVRRVAELSAPTDAPRSKAYRVEISGIGAVNLPAGKREGRIEQIREFRFPVAFDPPRATASSAPAMTPTTPTAFESVDTGLTIRLSAKAHGKLIAVYGIIDAVEFLGFDDGGYGALAGPVFTEQGVLVTPNKLQQPRFQTTNSRFHLFALPGETYDVTLHYEGKAVKHKVTVTAK